MKVWKLFLIYTRGKGKNPFFHFSDFLDFPKILKKEYNIRFKIYPSPFTSSPQHISIIVFPTFVFLFTELSHVVQERARSFSPLPLLYPSASDFQFHSAGDRWFRACGAYMWNLSGFFGDIILSFGDIFVFFGDILLSFGDNFLSIGVIFLSFGDIFRMISWYFLYFISRIHANRTNRIGRKRKCCIFATSIRSNAGFLKKTT